MLELRPNCECCDRDLPPDSADARICTYECTFCVACVEQRYAGRCPNCGGDFQPRPIRPAHLLADDPASTVRVRRADCAGVRAEGSVGAAGAGARATLRSPVHRAAERRG